MRPMLFLALTFAFVVPRIALADDDAGVDAGARPAACLAADAALAKSGEALAALRTVTTQAKTAKDQIPELRALIAREKANPSGVVDLRRLHDLGAELQTATEMAPKYEAARVLWVAEVKRILAEVGRLTTACGKTLGR